MLSCNPYCIERQEQGLAVNTVELKFTLCTIQVPLESHESDFTSEVPKSSANSRQVLRENCLL